jgi:hypothetical protein
MRNLSVVANLRLRYRAQASRYFETANGRRDRNRTEHNR